MTLLSHSTGMVNDTLQRLLGILIKISVSLIICAKIAVMSIIVSPNKVNCVIEIG